MSVASGEIVGRVASFREAFRKPVAGAGIRYRADIDGLRAVAVLPVVLFHYQVSPFTGGYVGVDVFFVISGYLITSLIWSEMQAGTFSVLKFYERRIRRIFPALFALLAVVSAAAAAILFPHTLMRYAMSLLATAGFISNFHFWGDSGYWAAAAAEKPLLHTWSLAVEEQFYLLFPGFLYLLRDRPKPQVLWALGATLALSLGLSIVGVYRWPITTFYLLPTRFWELLMGSVLAIGAFRLPESPWVRNLLSFAGLVLILASTVLLTSRSPFPGLNAIPPCLGTALILYAGTKGTTVTNGLLATRVPVFIGLISYSLYLWHWPIFVFVGEIVHDGLTPMETATCIAASFALAALSWRYIEQPFRGKASPIGRKPLFVMAGAAIAASATLGFALSAAKGLPQRYDPATRKIVQAMDDREPLRGRCFNLSPSHVRSGGLCKFGAKSAPATFILWGDSHADAMVPAVMKAARAQGKAGYLGAHGHCAPLVGVTFPDKECRPFNDAIAEAAMRPEIKTVLLDAKWASPAGESGLGKERTGWNTDDESQIAPGQGETRAVFARALARTVKMLRDAGKKVIVIGPTPEFVKSVPNELAKMRVWGGQWQVAPTRVAYMAREAYAYSVFEDVAKRYGAKLVLLDRRLCPGVRCTTLEEGRPLFRDNSHLSAFGSQQLAPLFDGLL